MKILFDIGHPAHVHYSKHLIRLLKNDPSNSILIIARDKEITFELLSLEKLDFISRGSGGKSTLGKIFYLIKADYHIFKISLSFKPDIFVSFMTPYPTHIAKLMQKPSIVITDTEHSVEQIRLFKNFATLILTPSCFRTNLGEKQKRVNSYLELLYLHPNYFTPNEMIKKELGIGHDEKYVIVRFVSWAASHDKGHPGLSNEFKIRLIKVLKKYAKVFISSEKELPVELEGYRFPLNSSKMHCALAFSDLLYGESATMASEAANLGTYAIFHDDVGRGYTDELEYKYNLVYNFNETITQQEKALEKAIQILSNPNSKKESMLKRQLLLKDKIDFTDYLLKILINFKNKGKLLY